jgi:hypothetical protein
VCSEKILHVQFHYDLKNFIKRVRFHYVMIWVDGDITCKFLTNNYSVSYFTHYARNLVILCYYLTHLLNYILYSDYYQWTLDLYDLYGRGGKISKKRLLVSSFVSVSLAIRPSTWTTRLSLDGFSSKFDICVFFENLFEKIKVSLNSGK